MDLREKKFDTALARVNEVLARRPTDADAIALKGDVQAAAGKLRDAIDSYSVAQRARPDAATAVKLYQARRAAALPKPEESLLQWVAMQPADYRVRGVLAEYYLTIGSLRQSADEFEAVVQQSTSNPVALNNLGWVYQQLGDPRAESVAQRAYQLAPSSAAVADTLGWILAQKRATDRALPLLEKAARNNAGVPQFQYHYAFALAQAGRRHEARETLARALPGGRGFPERREAERLLAELE
jgi:tetratricopeptide (TPR) repeat protein